MKVSARNVFKGKISALRSGTVNAEVQITLPGGDRLVAIITLASARTLELAEGKDVIALVKAPWVMLMTDHDDVRLSARNTLTGTITAVEMGSVNAEVTLALDGGTKIHAVITRDAVAELALKPGGVATAIIKASSIILGIPA
jgi:molybdate transport system regulatory protein